MTQSLLIKQITPEIYFNAEPDALWLRSTTDLSNPREWKTRIPDNSEWTNLPIEIEQLLEMGLAECREENIKFSYRDLGEIESKGFSFVQRLGETAPFFLEIESRGSLGRPDFRYVLRFLFGIREVPIVPFGAFVTYNNTIYRFDAQTYALIDEIKKFNCGQDDKTKSSALISFREIKELSSGLGSKLDAYLSANSVIVPARTSIELFEDEDGAITLLPRFDGVPEAQIKKMFLQLSDVQDVYDLEDEHGKRIRVVLDDNQQEILKRMQKVRHLTGLERKKVLANPQAIFDGVDASRIDLSHYGKRVKGIGDFAFTAVPFAAYTRTGILHHPEMEQDFEIPQKCGLRLPVPGSDENDVIEFNGLREVSKTLRMVKEALSAGKQEIHIKGKPILLSPELYQGLSALEERFTKPQSKTAKSDDKTGKYLLIFTNYEKLEYTEEEIDATPDTKFELPKSLSSENQLKSYQIEGASWLQRRYNSLRDSGGALLADDMGLGKTLQILTFLAWLLETGQTKRGNGDAETFPWNPILIVTPKVLFDTKTWLEDSSRFFKRSGNVFYPFLELHGKRLKEFRKDSSGREVKLGQPILDIDKFYEYRLILTNYDTIVNYQHSFAQVDWSIIVTDEAQEYKTPNSKISHAIKALKTSFRIGSTGTPVENRLLDIWNLTDFIQPGLLGEAKQFTNRFEKPFEHGEGAKALDDLRISLRYMHPDAFVLRREKGIHLKDLPEKYEHVIESFIKPEHWELHKDIVQRSKINRTSNWALSAIQKLLMLYQHPWLLDSSPKLQYSAQDAFDASPKLHSVAQMLETISAQKEKVIIFANYIEMQQILKRAFEEHFGLSIDIINGGDTGDVIKRTSMTRNHILSRFKEKPGFNILILSPRVAGIGLTIVEANHVIHYGRWWNPALEAQATDRVYRIGQTKPVHVYLPILKHKDSTFKTFDEKLHDVLERKSNLAKDFLFPMPGEHEIGAELEEEIVNTTPETNVNPLNYDDLKRLNPEEFEALFAAIFSKLGYDTILTPYTSDGQVDVIASKGEEICLIQCKHTVHPEMENDNAVGEVCGALEYLRAERCISALKIRLIIAGNTGVSKAVWKSAKSRECEVIDGNECMKLIETTAVTFADMELAEQRRLQSLPQVLKQLKQNPL